MTFEVAHHRAVVVMAKRPAAGSTKTRLSPTLSPQQAADVYEQLLLDTLRYLGNRGDCTTIIAIDEAESADYFQSIAPGVAQVQQLGNTLGARLDTVMTECLGSGFQSTFAISSDSPDLPPNHLDDAFRALDQPEVDVVVGPTEDGGYYLIGWKQPWPRLVRDVEMSTPRVLQETLEIAAELGANVHLAASWYDIDLPEDLERLRTSVSDPAELGTTTLLAEL